MPRRPRLRPAALAVAAVLLAIAGTAAARAQLASDEPAAPPRPAAVPTPPQVAVPPVPAPAPQPAPVPRPTYDPPRYPDSPSRAQGSPNAGRLIDGVLLPVEGPDHATWHPIRKQRPNAAWRRHGTDRLIRTILRVAAEHRAANPGAPRVLIGDLSRPEGGDFGAAVSGGLGHASHQNGLDVDVYYPRRDRRLRRPHRVAQVDRALAQDLVDRFVAAGAQFVFVGPNTGLTGPPGVVQPLAHHDDHLHVRLQPSR